MALASRWLLGYTDQAPVYYDLGKEKEYDHQVINHLEKYVDGRVSTQLT